MIPKFFTNKSSLKKKSIPPSLSTKVVNRKRKYIRNTATIRKIYCCKKKVPSILSIDLSKGIPNWSIRIHEKIIVISSLPDFFWVRWVRVVEFYKVYNLNSNQLIKFWDFFIFISTSSQHQCTTNVHLHS